MKKSPVVFKTLSNNPSFEGVCDIDAGELAEKTASVHVIDVRSTEEYTDELGHIEGSRLFVLDSLPNRIDELPKDEPIVFICKSGGRSARAAAFAVEMGFQHVFNMKGGMLRWNQLGLPVQK